MKTALQINNSVENREIGKIDDQIISYLIDNFGDIPVVVPKEQEFAANDTIFNKPTITQDHPLAQILTWLPKFTPNTQIKEEAILNEVIKKEPELKIFYPSQNYNIIYQNESLNQENLFKNEEPNLPKQEQINYDFKTQQESSNNQYNLNNNQKTTLENLIPNYNNSFFNTQNQLNNTNYSLENKLNTTQNSYYIPSKSLYQRRY